MRIGLACDLKDAVRSEIIADDELEEYDSVETVDIIMASLENLGHTVVMLGGGKGFITKTIDENVDIVFNIAEGRGTYRSREAQVPAVLEMLNVPYSGSDPQCLAICLDKPLTKTLVNLAGITTPKWIVVKTEDQLKSEDLSALTFPVIVKPAYEGSSKGVRATSFVIDGDEAFREVQHQLVNYRQPVMVEEFVDGDEVTVGITGNSPPEVLGIMRILPRVKTDNFIYSLEVKRDWERLVDYECPAHLDEEVLLRIKENSLKIFEVLGCRDFARIDFRVSKDGIPYFIEINPLPGLGTYSDLVIMAIKLGWTHQGLITSVFNAALSRYPQYICI
ncbi:MAG: ATP-grasp domain-containing protein [Dehalococcoidales bacterium]|nr:ATP-grasp domain-containing protein [Dehalococcoidales bacterium]